MQSNYMGHRVIANAATAPLQVLRINHQRGQLNLSGGCTRLPLRVHTAGVGD